MRLFLLCTILLPLHAQLAFTIKSSATSQEDQMTARLPALLVKKGETASPFLPEGKFTADWKGKLTLKERMRLSFSFAGEGTATLTIDQKEILTEKGKLGAAKNDPLRLNPGEHEIAIHYESNDDGSAAFRLYWEERSFPKQSVPPTAFAKLTEQPSAQTAAMHQGRTLFATMNCAKCHIAQNSLGSDPMPEMLEMPPLLAGAGDRFQENWIANWISQPRKLRAHSTMPDLLDVSTEEGKQQAADIAAFLSSQKSSSLPASTTSAELTKKGGEIFNALGCVACHTMPDQNQADVTHQRIPLHNVAAKYKEGALMTFLKNPSALAPHIRMPNFKLSDDEAAALTSFLTEKSQGKSSLEKFPAGDADRGIKLTQENQCGLCHAGLPVSEKLPPAMESLFGKAPNLKSCIDENADLTKTPRYHFSADEKNALATFLSSSPDSLKVNDLSQYSERNFTALRCNACHARDGVPSLLETTQNESQSLAAENTHGKVDQTRPHLTMIGEMLQPECLTQTLEGTVTRARPWLDMRMPSFESRAKNLSASLSLTHGVDPQEKQNIPLDSAQAAQGKELIASTTGLGCTTCHAVGEQKESAAFEVIGVNLSLTKSRLRKEWYDRWMDKPISVTPSSKMPIFSNDGKTNLLQFYNGDSAQQFNAIFQYLLTQ